MSKRNLKSLQHLADEEQELYIQIRRSRIKKQSEKMFQEDKNLLDKYANNNKDKSKKFDYFKWITKNNIYDFSDGSKHSHLDSLPDDITSKFQELNEREFKVSKVACRKLSSIMEMPISLKISWLMSRKQLFLIAQNVLIKKYIDSS